ncbi:MAG: hypothetical protein HQ530_00330 [Parcubacteria group bacterium]|nr:hypothetical protein [Parcubacteria group bacterium]
MDKKEKKEKNEPAPWNPIDIKKFNENTRTISEMYRSDPERIKRAEGENDDDKNE